MKRVLLDLALGLAIIFVSISIIMGIYMGPRDVLYLKGDILGSGYWDSAFLTRLEFGKDFEAICSRYYGEKYLKWPIPISINRETVQGVVFQFFENEIYLENFRRNIVSKSKYLIYDQDEFFRELQQARGLKALIVRKATGMPVVVFERNPGGKMVETWINPDLKREPEKKTRKKILV